MNRKRNAARDTAAVGAVTAASVAHFASSLGDSAPDVNDKLSAKVVPGNGFAKIANYQSLVFTTVFLYAAVIGGLYWLNLHNQQLSGFFGLMVLIGGVGVSLGIGFTLWFQLPQYASLKLRARWWPVEENMRERQRAGCGVLGNPLADAIFTTPFYLAGIAFALPFWILGMVFEILRAMFVPGAHYRGDQGKYYDKVRKEYAVQWSKYGEYDANKWLREAYGGLLSEPGTIIPWELWANRKYRALLAPMIERHGPVNKYCKGLPGKPKGTVSKTIPSKYSAI